MSLRVLPRLRRRALPRLGSGSTSARWTRPATVMTVAGLHGGAGASTLTLLIAHKVASCGDAPVLVVDLAGRTRGGLGTLANAWSQSSTEAAAAIAVVHRGRLARPYGVTPDGVRVMSAEPETLADLERSHETLVAQLVEHIARGVDDCRLGEAARHAVLDDRSYQALRWDSDQVANALGRMLDQAMHHHALVVVDLGMVDSERVAHSVRSRSHLHLWAVPGREDALDIARRRLACHPFQAAAREAIVVWQANGRRPSAKRLSDLGDIRGCPVVRLAHHGERDAGWAAMVDRCLSGLIDLCELAR